MHTNKFYNVIGCCCLFITFQLLIQMDSPQQLACSKQIPSSTVDQVSQFTMTDSGGIKSCLARAVVFAVLLDSLHGPRLTNCCLPAATCAELLVRLGLAHAQNYYAAICVLNKVNFVLVSWWHAHFAHGTNQFIIFCLNIMLKILYYFCEKGRQVHYLLQLDKAWWKERAEQAEKWWTPWLLFLDLMPGPWPAGASTHTTSDNQENLQDGDRLQVIGNSSEPPPPSKVQMTDDLSGGVIAFPLPLMLRSSIPLYMH